MGTILAIKGDFFLEKKWDFWRTFEAKEGEPFMEAIGALRKAKAWINEVKPPSKLAFY